jgi:hypothetical protein
MKIFVSYVCYKYGNSHFNNDEIECDYPPQDFADIGKIEVILNNKEDGDCRIINWKKYKE